MFKSEIMELASALCRAGAEELEALCAAAEMELGGRLKDGVSPEDCREAFIIAASFIAADMYTAAQTADGVQSYKAGAVSVTRSAGGTGSEMRDRAEIIMAPYIVDGRFDFRSVEG